MNNVKCPHCAEEILPEAKVCKHCKLHVVEPPSTEPPCRACGGENVPATVEKPDPGGAAVIVVLGVLVALFAHFVGGLILLALGFLIGAVSKTKVQGWKCSGCGGERYESRA